MPFRLRARYLNPDTGRFWTQDPFEGFGTDPQSLHKYTYCGSDPVNCHDPAGYLTLTEAYVTTSIASIINAMTVHAGVDTLLRAQRVLAEAGLAGPELYEAIEVVLYYQLFSDLYVGYSFGRLAAVLSSGTLAKLQSVWGRLSQLTPADWVRARLLVPRQAAKSEVTALTKFYPENAGFAGATERTFLMPGQKIDRYGGSGYSRFFSPQGTPDWARSLPPGTAAQPLRTFEVVKPFEVESGTVAPWFNQPGGGVQYVTPVRLEILLKRGILREVTQ